jgi:serine protease Do
MNFKQIFKGNKTVQPGFIKGFAMGLAMLALVLGGALGFRAAYDEGAASVVANAPSTLTKGFEQVAKEVEGAVVNINTEQIIRNSSGSMQEDPFQQFFGGQDPFGGFFGRIPRDMKQKSLGSGFIVDPQGYILTNNHVIENASSIKVKLDDGHVMDAKVIGTDPQTDLAVLQIKGTNLPTLKLANSDQVQVGDWVLAFGSPFGLEKTMTAGIISAKARVIGAGPYDNFLQTDAAINPGNSGGPLVNLNGEVIGINTMIASESGGFQGIGFAIPASMAGRVYHQIVGSGKVTRGWLGVTIQSMTPELAKSFNLPEDKGVLVADVQSNGPAAKAGIQSGDVILAYNGKELHSSNDLSLAVADTPVGNSATLKVLREGKDLSMQVTVGERPADVAANFPSSTSRQEQGKLGITVENITPEAARQMQLSSNVGALVTEVRPNSPADDVGIRAGDVIRSINNANVANAGDMASATRNLKSGDTVRLRILRNGQNLFVAFDLS